MCLSFWIRGNTVTKLQKLKKTTSQPVDWCFQSSTSSGIWWSDLKPMLVSVDKGGCGCPAQLWFSLPVLQGLHYVALVQPEVEDTSTFVRVSSSLFSGRLPPILVNYILYLVLQCTQTLLKGHLIWEGRCKVFPQSPICGEHIERALF